MNHWRTTVQQYLVPLVLGVPGTILILRVHLSAVLMLVHASVVVQYLVPRPCLQLR
jgi:hypothetical protein